jgi:ankyrin repeat protein
MCGTQRALTYFIQTNNEVGLSLFLERGRGRVDIEVCLPAFDMSHLDNDGLIDDESFEDESLEIEPIPLLVVVSMDLVPLARILLQHGAKVEYFDSDRFGIFSPLHAARSAEMVHLLLDHHANTEITDERAFEPLYWYTIRDDIAAMQAILERGANVNSLPLPFQPLHKAAERCLATTKLLVEYGANVDAKDLHGNTPLHVAGVRGLTDVVRFLLECWPEGARERNEVEDTPLHFAAAWGRIDVMQLLSEVWPEGKEALNEQELTPLEVFELKGRYQL